MLAGLLFLSPYLLGSYRVRNSHTSTSRTFSDTFSQTLIDSSSPRPHNDPGTYNQPYTRYLKGRLWREAEYTALLLRRVRIDFPRLTRFALYISAALYPDHDQSCINHVLLGTGWAVKSYSKAWEVV